MTHRPRHADVVAPTSDDARSRTRDSITVALWTAISRVTGVVRVAVIAAVLGPTLLGNTYQFTNSVPNLVYYGLLGGSLVSSLLVPVLVRHLAAGRPERTAAVARGFLGCAMIAAAAAVPVLAVTVPLILRSTSAGDVHAAHAQLTAAAWLVVLLAPQTVCYAVIACSVAVMNAHRRFAIAAAAPTIENLGCLVVLGVAALTFGTGADLSDVSGAEIALLGLGTTGAVVVHAAVQWCGALRSGVALVPKRGWRDAEVRRVVARGACAVVQAGLWAIQLLVALALANRVPGGVVAVLIATNFFFLPIALAATPIALAALPRLSAQHLAGQHRELDAAVVDTVSLAAFVTVPAGVGYVVLAPRLAKAISFGSASTPLARELITYALAALAIGVVGTALFTVATYVSYARNDARSPLRAMLVQSVVAVAIMCCSLAVNGRFSILPVAGGLAAGTFVGAGLLLRRIAAGGAGLGRVLASLPRTLVCVAVMAPVVWLCDREVAGAVPSRAGQLGALAVAVVVGAGVYLLAQRAARSPELALLTRSVSRRSAAGVAVTEDVSP